MGFFPKPIKFQILILNSFSDSFFGINLLDSASSRSVPDMIHMDGHGPDRRVDELENYFSAPRLTFYSGFSANDGVMPGQHLPA